eukprot:TRINITY_DN61952_c0_g1_i1.p1 TRINITY_DN61952_c0_g1~~TRINITY_DN61952_c0_g1_i1.p1  ORF type:complete len:191 (-),score=49.34 TRINITY_DN61952_c0_g1_i1:45-617(-)
MNTVLAALLATTASASILPLKFNFGNSHPTLKAVKQCDGHENDVLVVIEGTTPDEICMPGDTELNVHTRISEDLPMDLLIKMDLHKLTPFPMTVPCLNGVGSCEYEICPMIESMADSLCPSFPEYQPCACPLLAGEMELYGVKTPVQDMGPILGAVMEGEYQATANFYAESNKDRILGCVEFTFALKQCP